VNTDQGMGTMALACVKKRQLWYVSAVIQGSPAFKANILDGDIIIQIADQPVSDHQELSDYYVAHAGQKVTMKLIRNGQTLDVDVQLNERP
jgi:S1-C subfamily serine protease